MEKLRKGFRFRISGMPEDIYEIVNIQKDIFDVEMNGSGKKYPIDKKDLEDMLNTGALEPIEEIKQKSDQDGMICSSCKKFIPYAQPNQPDNKTLICYSCRNFP